MTVKLIQKKNLLMDSLRVNVVAQYCRSHFKKEK